MAEKFVIFEAEIDTQKAVTDTKRLKEEVALLKSQAQQAKREQGELSEEYIQYSAALKSAQGELRKQETLTKNIITAQNDQSGSLNSLKAQLSVVTAEWNSLSEEERLNTDVGRELTDAKTKLTAQLKGEEMATGDARRNVGNYKEGMDEALQSVGNFVPAAGKASVAAKTLGRAFTVALGPIGILIALIGGLVAAVKTFFASSEEGQNALREFQQVGSVTFNNLRDRFAALGESVWNFVSDTDNLKEQLGNVWDSIKDRSKNVIEDIKGIKEGFIDPIGSAKDFFNSITDIGNRANEVFVGGFKKFIELASANVQVGINKIILTFEKLRSKVTGDVDKMEEAQTEYNAALETASVLNGKLADRVKQTKVYQTIKNGVDAATEAVKDFNEENEREIEIARRLAKQQNALDKQMRQAMVDEARLRKEVSELRTQVVDKENLSAEERIRLIDEATEKERQILETNVDIAKQKLQIKQEQNALSNSTKEDLDEEARLRAEVFRQEEQFNARVRELQTQKQEALRQAAAENAAIAEQEFNDLLTIFEEGEIETDKYLANRLEAAQMNYDNELALAEENIFRKLELQREALEREKEQEVAYAKAIGADVELVKDRYRQMDLQLEAAQQEAKLSIAAGFANNLATIFGENTKIGKAAAIVATAIDTYRGAQAAFAQTPGGIVVKSVAAAAAVATGLRNIQKIRSMNTDVRKSASVSVSSGGSSATNTTTPPPQALVPQIGQSIIGQTTGTMGQQQTDGKVLVVDDVTFRQQQKEKAQAVSSI